MRIRKQIRKKYLWHSAEIHLKGSAMSNVSLKQPGFKCQGGLNKICLSIQIIALKIEHSGSNHQESVVPRINHHKSPIQVWSNFSILDGYPLQFNGFRIIESQNIHIDLKRMLVFHLDMDIEIDIETEIETQFDTDTDKRQREIQRQRSAQIKICKYDMFGDTRQYLSHSIPGHFRTPELAEGTSIPVGSTASLSSWT